MRDADEMQKADTEFKSRTQNQTRGQGNTYIKALPNPKKTPKLSSLGTGTDWGAITATTAAQLPRCKQSTQYASINPSRNTQEQYPARVYLRNARRS